MRGAAARPPGGRCGLSLELREWRAAGRRRRGVRQEAPRRAGRRRPERAIHHGGLSHSRRVRGARLWCSTRNLDSCLRTSRRRRLGSHGRNHSCATMMVSSIHRSSSRGLHGLLARRSGGERRGWKLVSTRWLIAISAQHAIAETRLGPTTVGCLEKAALASSADICQREQISALLLGLMASSFPKPKTQKNTASNSRETFCAGLGRTTSASTSDD